jgi:hypothetical protein
VGKYRYRTSKDNLFFAAPRQRKATARFEMVSFVWSNNRGPQNREEAFKEAWCKPHAVADDRDLFKVRHDLLACSVAAEAFS